MRAWTYFRSSRIFLLMFTSLVTACAAADERAAVMDEAYVVGPTVELLAQAISDPQVVIVVVESWTFDNRTDAEREADNFFEVASAHSFFWSRTPVIDAIRGDVEPIIYIEHSFAMVEGQMQPPYMPKPATHFLMLLETPFDEDSERERDFMQRYRELNAGTFMNRDNLFMRLGDYWKEPLPEFSAIVLDWPEDEPHDPLLPVATPSLPKELKRIVATLDAHRDDSAKFHKCMQKLLGTVTDPYAQAALHLLVAKQAGPAVGSESDGIVLRSTVPDEVEADASIPVMVSLSNQTRETIRHWKYRHAPLELNLRIARASDNIPESTRRGPSVLGQVLQGSHISVPLGPGKAHEWNLDLREHYDLAPGAYVVTVTVGFASATIPSRTLTVTERITIGE